MDKGPVKATHTLYIGKLGECPDLPRISRGLILMPKRKSENILVSDLTSQKSYGLAETQFITI